MIDWVVVADVGTAGGTALLAVATFFSTRSANTAARSAERSLLLGLRPILVPSQWEQPIQKVHFIDGRWLVVRGGRAALEATDEAVYLVLSVRNPGAGLAVIHGWDLAAGNFDAPRDVSVFRHQTRDIYVPAGDTGFCQVAVRDPSSADFRYLTERFDDREPFWVDLLYSDSEGGQRVITRMGMSCSPASDRTDSEWAVSAARHWNLDRPNPR
jgi:hypothetical protein